MLSTSPGTTCIVDALTSYNGSIKAVVKSSAVSTEGALEALAFHKHALLFTEKSKPRKACHFLGKCGGIAGKMSTEQVLATTR